MDAKAEADKEAYLKPLRDQSDFMKIFSYNNPKWLIIPALLAVAAAGFCQPLFGWVFSKMMQILTVDP